MRLTILVFILENINKTFGVIQKRTEVKSENSTNSKLYLYKLFPLT